MSGGKGGSTTQTTQQTIPDYLEAPIRRNIAKAEDLAQIGFTPYMGPEVAAMTPMQQAAMRNTSQAAQAYGLQAAPGQEIMPEPQTFAGGIQGYSSFPLYEQALAELEARMPGQYAALTAPFIDPVTGAEPLSPYGNGGQAQNGTSGGAMDAQSVYEALGYKKVPSYMHPGSGDGIYRVDKDGAQGQTVFMRPDVFENRFGR